MTDTPAPSSSGMPYALAAFTIWGLLPFYFLFVIDVPPLELVGWRIAFTLPVCLAIVAVRGQARQLKQALGNPKTLGIMALSALLIGINWLVFVIAVQNGHVLATSLGYYINPMVNVLLGTLFLKERLSKAQWLAVSLASAGVVILVLGALDTLWISLTLALSFSSYGLVRKVAPVDAVPGLTIETLIWLLPCLGAIAWYAASPAGSSFTQSPQMAGLLAMSGVLTAVPLLFFAVAARRMAYSALGFVQFLGPSLSFLIGLFVFREPLDSTKLACFCFIWVAIAVFCWDLLARRKKAPEVQLPTA